MKIEKKLARLNTVNQLLEELNDSVPVEKGKVRAAIQQAYASINKLDSTTKCYKQVPEAINELNSQLQLFAVAKEYHFSAEQDKLISELTTFTNKMFAHGWYGLIYF